MFGGLFDNEDERESSGSPAGIVVECGPLVEDKVFVDSGELHVIGAHLQDAYSALGEAVSLHRDLDRAGQEHCDEGAFQELDSVTLDALGAIERAWRAVCVVTDAHEAQLREADEAQELDDEDHDDTPDSVGCTARGSRPPVPKRERGAPTGTGSA